MGTTLNGTKPKNTYQALLKTTDNTAIDATLKTISDGLGTDTPLQLSTTETQINSTLRIHTDNAELLDIENASGSNRFNINRVVQNINLDFASKPTDITTQVGAIRTAIDGTNLADVIKFQENGQVTFTERVKLESDSTVTTQTSSVIQSSTTNANLVIAPNGTGAIIADIPDGLITGGNARGTNAVDLQMSRTNANQVASYNASAILSGTNNRNETQYSVICGGSGNTINYEDAYYISIVGGFQNTVGGRYGFIGGGQGNTGGGYSTGYTSILGGQGNTASGPHSSVLGGNANLASASYSSVIGGSACTSSGTYSSSGGAGGQAYLYAQKAFGNSNGTISPYFGNAQSSELISRKAATLTTGATTVLSLDGTGVTNLIIPLSNNRAWNVQVNWVAVVTAITGTATGISVGDVVTSVDLLAFKRVGGTSSASAHTSAATKLMVTTPAQYAAVQITYAAGASQEMALTFTGPTFIGGGSVTMQVVARVELSEVAW